MPKNIEQIIQPSGHTGQRTVLHSHIKKLRYRKRFKNNPNINFPFRIDFKKASTYQESEKLPYNHLSPGLVVREETQVQEVVGLNPGTRWTFFHIGILFV